MNQHTGSQKANILRFMQTKGSMTPWIAVHLFKCLRLSERIREIEDDGHLINRAMIYRGKKKYMSYSLVQ